MKKTQITLLAALITSVLGTSAVADDLAPNISSPGPYVAAALGPDWVAASKLQLFGNTETSHWTGGWGGDVAAGYRWGYGIRTELEGSARQAQIKSFNSNPWYGIQWDTSLMANMLYDIHTGTAFTPYVGGGVGLSHISWGNDFRGNHTFIYDDTGTRLGWQGIVGVAYALTHRLQLTADFRVKGSNGYRFSSNETPGSDVTHFDYMTRSLFFGLRYAID